MIEHILLVLAGFIKAVISSLGYPGIVVLMGIESACIPLPSEVIMPFAGYLVYQGRFSSLFVVATMGAIGCNLGSVLAYEVGAYGGRPLIERFGKYILMNRHDLDVSERFFQKYGVWTVVLAPFIPAPSPLFYMAAGEAGMPFVLFIVADLIGTLAYIGAIVAAGWIIGQPAVALAQTISNYALWIIVATVVLIFAWSFFSAWRNPRR